jgi:hypothetical protein
MVSFGRADLDKYNVIVLPHSWGGAEGYKRILGKGGVSRLKKWVESGGTIVGIGTGAAFLADSSVAISSVRPRRQALKKLSVYEAALAAAKEAEAPEVDSLSVWESKSEAEKKIDDEKKLKFELVKQVDERARRLYPRGAVLSVDLDNEHWLTVGCGATVPVMFNTSYAYLAGSSAQVPGRLGDSKRIRLSGLMWPEAKDRWGETAYVTRESKGKGQVILFATAPNFRGYFMGAERLLLNALFLGPGYGTRRTIDW